MREKIIIIATVLMGCVLVAALYLSQKSNSSRQAELEKNYEIIKPIEQEINRLNNQLITVEKDFIERMAGVASVEFIVPELDKRIFSDLKPIMDQYGAQAMLVISDSEFPGQDGKLSHDDFHKLLVAGWSYCIICKEENTAQFDEWLTYMESLMAANSIDKTDTVYFPSGVYSKDYDEILVSHGINNVIHHGEDNSEILVETGKGKPWKVGAMPVMSGNLKTSIEKAINQGANLTVTISFSNSEDQFNESTVKAILNQTTKGAEEDKLRITNIEGAKKLRKLADRTRKQLQPQLEEEMNKINEQIEDLRKQLDENQSKTVSMN